MSRMALGYLGEGGLTMLWDVPIDDEHHWRWEVIFHRSGALDKQALEQQYNAEKEEGDRLWRNGRPLYAQDRATMQDKAYVGLGECFSVHDVVITQSQGTIHQQADEHLSSSDMAIVRARRLLGEAGQDVMAGRDPRGVVRDPAHNDFRDLVVYTGEIGRADNRQACCAALIDDAALFEPLPVATEAHAST